jgi:hypothetical protein
MNSDPAVQAWVERWAESVRRERASLPAARDRLALGRQHVKRAQKLIDDGDPDGAAIFAEFALVNAADVVLLKDGFRIRGQTGSHQARFSYPLLPAAFTEGQDTVNEARMLRNRAAYEASGRVSRAQATTLTELADRALAEVARLL